MYFNVSHNMMFGQLQDGIGQMRLFKELQEETDGIMVGVGRATWWVWAGREYRSAWSALGVVRLSHQPQEDADGMMVGAGRATWWVWYQYAHLACQLLQLSSKPQGGVDGTVVGVGVGAAVRVCTPSTKITLAGRGTEAHHRCRRTPGRVCFSLAGSGTCSLCYGVGVGNGRCVHGNSTLHPAGAPSTHFLSACRSQCSGASRRPYTASSRLRESRSNCNPRRRPPPLSLPPSAPAPLSPSGRPTPPSTSRTTSSTHPSPRG